jgi:peptide chain release factor 2
VTAADYSDQLKTLDATLRNIEAVLDVDKLRRDKAALEEQASAPDLWDDQARAQVVTSRLSHVNSEIERLGALRGQLDDASVLLELAEGESDPGTLAEVGSEITSLHKAIEEMEVRTLLAGEYDSREALVAIRAGAGGVDAADFAEMLLRMYLRWCERHKFKTEMFDYQEGEEAGIKSAGFRVEGDYAYGLLAGEVGVHRLVRISPFNSGQSRETSFASVFITPEFDDNIEVEILDKDLRVDTYRSTGAGGQHINTTDSAVRITHLPTGIVVTCQNQRSQHQNRDVAMKVLRSRLYEMELAKKRAEADKLAESKRDISFGSQIRNYVLHPYKLVKDVRTKRETGNVDAVLDGEIDDFIKEYLMSKREV